MFTGSLIATFPTAAFAEERIETIESAEDPRMPSGYVTKLSLEETFVGGGDLGDALESVPGLDVRRSSSSGQPAWVSVRGGNARQVAVSFEGLRLSAPFGAGFDVGTLALAGIDSVAVHRGPAGVHRGSGALTGALELRTSLPEDEGWRTDASTLFGSHDTYGAQATAQIAANDTRARVATSWRQSEGGFRFVDDQGTTHARLNNDADRFGVLGAVAHDLADATFKSAVGFQSGERGTPGPSEFQERFSRARIEDERLFGVVRAERPSLLTRAWGGIDGYTFAGLQWRRQHYRNPRPMLGEVPIENDANYQSFGGGGGLLTYLRRGHIVHLDVDARTESYHAVQRAASDASIEASRQTAALSASDELLFFDGRLSLLAGTRAELTSDRGMQALPFAGAQAKVLEWLALRANGARTYRAPDFDELYLDHESVRGNAALEAERAWIWDAGFALGNAQIALHAAYFENHIESLIAFLPVTAYLIEARNLEGAIGRGVESSLLLVPHRRLAARLGYTFTRSHLREAPHLFLPHQPAHRAWADLRLELTGLAPWLDDGRGASLFARADARSEIALDTFGNQTDEGFVTADLGATAQPARWVRLHAVVKNVLDRRGIVDSLQRPLPGRTFFVGMTLTAAETAGDTR